MSRKKAPADELRDLIAASGLRRTEVCEQLDVSKRTLELWLTEQQPVPRMALMAMRWLRGLSEARSTS